MGYLIDLSQTIWTQLQEISYTVGTWTQTAASNLWTANKTAGADTSILKVPCPVSGSSDAGNGNKLKSITIEWVNATKDINDITAVLQIATLPAQAGTHSKTTPAVTYDAAHDTTAERKTQAQHRMIISITDPFFIGQYEDVYLELTVNAADTSAFKLQGVGWNFDERR
jgi:hypothetical protein